MPFLVITVLSNSPYPYILNLPGHNLCLTTSESEWHL